VQSQRTARLRVALLVYRATLVRVAKASIPLLSRELAAGHEVTVSPARPWPVWTGTTVGTRRHADTKVTVARHGGVRLVKSSSLYGSRPSPAGAGEIRDWVDLVESDMMTGASGARTFSLRAAACWRGRGAGWTSCTTTSPSGPVCSVSWRRVACDRHLHHPVTVDRWVEDLSHAVSGAGTVVRRWYALRRYAKRVAGDCPLLTVSPVRRDIVDRWASAPER